MTARTTRQTLLGRLHDAADQAAWREFETQYLDLILCYCRRRGLQQSDAEDVGQIVFTSLTVLFRRGFEHDPGKGRFRTYLGRAVQNAVNRWVQRPGQDVQRLSTWVADNMLEGRDSVDEAWQQEWEQHHMRRALCTVRRTYESSSLAVFEALLRGQSIAGAAQSFGMNEQAVYKIRSRVRARIEQLIAEQTREEDRLVSQPE